MMHLWSLTSGQAENVIMRIFFVMFCGCQGKLKEGYQKSFTYGHPWTSELTFVLFM